VRDGRLALVGSGVDSQHQIGAITGIKVILPDNDYHRQTLNKAIYITFF